MPSCPLHILMCWWSCGRQRKRTSKNEITVTTSIDDKPRVGWGKGHGNGEALGTVQNSTPDFPEQQISTDTPTRKIFLNTEGPLDQVEGINIDDDDNDNIWATQVKRPSDITINLSVVEEEPSIFTDKSGLESNDDETLVSYCFRHKNESSSKRNKKLNLSSKESHCLSRLAGIREF